MIASATVAIKEEIDQQEAKLEDLGRKYQPLVKKASQATAAQMRVYNEIEVVKLRLRRLENALLALGEDGTCHGPS